MFTWLISLLPGPRWSHVLIGFVLVAVAVYVCMSWVYPALLPWVDEHLGTPEIGGSE